MNLYFFGLLSEFYGECLCFPHLEYKCTCEVFLQYNNMSALLLEFHLSWTTSPMGMPAQSQSMEHILSDLLLCILINLQS